MPRVGIRPQEFSMVSRFLVRGIAACFLFLCGAAFAQNMDVQGAWARATVPGQRASGAFMKITSSTGATLTSVSSPVASVVEVHEMKMDGDVMKMRALDGGLTLPAGKTVELKPGGYHIMLMDLKGPLIKDTTIPLILVFKDAKGIETRTEIKVPVAGMPPTALADH
jgi:copper(I)-binding protein